MARIANNDVIVVLPGILGTTLARDGRSVWGYGAIGRHLLTLRRQLTEDLTLGHDAFSDPERGAVDGIVPSGVLTTLGIIPGFWSVQGYDHLLAYLTKSFAEDADSVLSFPYDWRQSNRVSAHRLQEFVDPIMAARRAATPDARLVLIGHSMGGLVARYYAECLDKEHHTRRVISIGTPYRGSVKALAVLANGFVKLGPLKLDLEQMTRSLPSVAELLPTYECVGADDRSLSTLTDDPVAALPEALLTHAVEFHAEMRAAAAANSEPPRYHSLVGHIQPTDAWATVAGDGEVVAVRPDDMGDRGDGTVWQGAATPPEWEDTAEASFFAGKHASLQQTSGVQTQLHGVLLDRPKRGPGTAGEEIGATASEFVVPHDTWTVQVEAASGQDDLDLRAVLVREGADEVTDLPTVLPLEPIGDGRYEAGVILADPGVYRWTVDASPGATPVGVLSDVTLCADAEG